MSTKDAKFTVPGLKVADGHRVGELLQGRLHALNDLQLTLKHAHWNVVGRDFIGVHEMLDPQIEDVRGYVDDLAERMAALGVSPNGLPGDLVKTRTWDDYPVGRATTLEHLKALDAVYDGVIEDHRKVIEELDDLDLVTQDMVIGQTQGLEQFQWFVRAHLENAGGELVPDAVAAADPARTKKNAAKSGKTNQGSTTSPSSTKKATVSAKKQAPAQKPAKKKS